jgi:3-deoxy-D-manno-octulosonate 8-phosphate phosphatase (KDO 8-P phosphatase)
MQVSDDVLARARRIKMVAMDVDGVLTDGSIVIGPDGESKVFNVRDGLAITVARAAGLRFAFVTGRASAAVERRAAELHIEVLEMACSGKAEALAGIAERTALSLTEIAFLGDDWNDLPAMRAAGLSGAPADSPYDIRRHADYVASARGGHGAVREFLEWLLDAQGGWTNAAEAYLETLAAGATVRQ